MQVTNATDRARSGDMAKRQGGSGQLDSNLKSAFRSEAGPTGAEPNSKWQLPDTLDMVIPNK